MTIACKSHWRTKRQVVNEPTYPNIGEWRAATRQKVVEWATHDRKPKKKKGGAILAVRSRLRPVDIYCYLKARFGEPNGFQSFLRKDDKR